MTCETCLHAVPANEDGVYVSCRRYPPVSHFISGPYGEQQVCVWPTLEAGNVCGEHFPKTKQ